MTGKLLGASKLKHLAERASGAVTFETLAGRSVQAVTLLSGIGGRFLERIAPPEETSVGFALGIATIAAFVGYILVLVFARYLKQWKIWFAISGLAFICFLCLAYKYNMDRGRLTFVWSPDETSQELKVAGKELTPEAQKAKNDDPSLTAVQLVSGFGGIDARTRVWPEDSILEASSTLKVDYVALFLSVAAAVFCATEGILLRRPKTRKARPRN